MKRNSVIFTIIFALFLIIVLAFTGCACLERLPQSQSPIHSQIPTENATSLPSEVASSTPCTTECSSFKYRLDYSIIPTAIMPKLSKADIEAYEAVIRAFAEFETSVTVTENDGINNLTELIDLCFPVFFADVFDSAFKIEGNTVSWSYNVDKETHYSLISEFEDVVLEKLFEVNQGNAKEASTLMRMLVLYKRITNDMNYSYASQSFFHGECNLTEDQYMNHAYDALISERGVCWCYARAYAFLLNHAGIEALTVSCDGGIGHHEWTMFQYDDSWFFADPTWDMQGRLSYFGMTSKNREADNYLLSDMKYFAGGLHSVSKDFVIDDTRFDTLVHGTYGQFFSYELDYKHDRINIKCITNDWQFKTVYFNLNDCEIK